MHDKRQELESYKEELKNKKKERVRLLWCHVVRIDIAH
jgi:hypothetical protein